jgi:5-methylthioadenosine/S-adenosylhomocysteine deaminase
MNLVMGKYVITMDERRRVIRDGCVVYDRNRIIDVGKTETLRKRYKVDEVLGGDEFIVMPGMINTHMHLEFSLFRGLWDQIPLYLLKRSIARAVPFMTSEDIYISSLMSLVDLVKNGVTTTIHIGPNADEAAKAMDKLKVRGIVCEALQDRVVGEKEAPPKSTDQCLKDGIRLIEKWRNCKHGRIKAWFGPYTELLTTPELLKSVKELSKEYNTGIHIHLAETYESQMFIMGLYGKRVYEYVYDLGLLGPNVVAAHGCWLSENEIKIIKKTNTNIAYCPCVEMMIADGIAPVPRLISEGVNVSIAIDDNANNQTSDLIREARVASLLHKGLLPLDASVMPPEQTLEMITINPAKALQLSDEIGSLEPGKKADIILINIKKPYFMPILDRPKTNIISNLVYAGSGSDVDTVIVDGEIIVKNKVVQTVDEEELLRKFQRAAEDFMDRSGYTIEEKGKLLWPIE